MKSIVGYIGGKAQSIWGECEIYRSLNGDWDVYLPDGRVYWVDFKGRQPLDDDLLPAVWLEEQEMSRYPNNYERAQRSYDAQEPPEYYRTAEDDEWEQSCENLGHDWELESTDGAEWIFRCTRCGEEKTE